MQTKCMEYIEYNDIDFEGILTMSKRNDFNSFHLHVTTFQHIFI